MKNDLISTRRNQTSVFSICFLMVVFWFIASMTVHAQTRVTKSFEKEIEIGQEVIIRTAGPTIDRVRGNGKIGTMYNSDGYFVVAKSIGDASIYEMNRRLNVHSWDQAKVKQVTEITLECLEPNQTEELLAALTIDLRQDAGNTVNVYYEMNISLLQIENGWFREDNNSIVLNNGKEYKLTYLKLTTQLNIPKNNKLILSGKDVTFDLQEHHGDVELEMEKGSFKARSLKNIKANLDAVEFEIGNIQNADLTARHAKVKIDEIMALRVESELSTFLIKKADQIIAKKLVNEYWKLEEIGSLKINAGLFSEFTIANLSANAELMLKNSDVRIQTVGREVSYVIIENQNAAVDIGVGTLDHYALTCKYFAQADYHLPADLKENTSDETVKFFVRGEKNTDTTQFDIRCRFCEVTLKS